MVREWMCVMVSSAESGTLKSARKAWRDRQYEKGWAYKCINGQHPDCGGYQGRLHGKTQLPRETCTCPCHDDAEQLFAPVGDDPW